MTSKQPAGQIDFAEGSVRRKTLALAAPMLVAQMLNLLYNIVDRIYIGKIPGEGTAALAGLGLCFPVVTLVTAFTNLFGAGGAPLCSIARGRGSRETAQNIMRNAYFMLLVCGVALTAVGLIFHRSILYLFGASDATYPYAASYLTIYLLGTLCVMTSLGLNPYINCQGFAKIGMLTVVVGAVANLVLDPVFIFALHLGVRGAAIATVISQALSAVWVLRFLTGRQAELKIGFRGFRPDFACIRRIAALGVSSFVMSFTDSLVQVACNATLRTFGGDIYISVMTVLNSVRQIAQTPVMAIADGATAVISFNYGAKRPDRMKRVVQLNLLRLHRAQLAADFAVPLGVHPDFQSGRGAAQGGSPGAAYLFLRLRHDGVPVFRPEHVQIAEQSRIRGVLLAAAQGVHRCAADAAPAAPRRSWGERRFRRRTDFQSRGRPRLLHHHAVHGHARAPAAGKAAAQPVKK